MTLTKNKKEKTIGYWKGEAWKWFSIFIRLFYSDKNGFVRCYTCGKRMFWKGEGAQAGHFEGGRGNSVLLDEEQVRAQCYVCNCCRGGEQYTFGKNLEKEVGEEKVLELKRKRHQTLKVSKKEWMEKASEYQLKAVELAVEKNLEI